MSNVAERIELHTCLANWSQGLLGMYVSDIEAIPEDKLGTSPGGVARSPQAITGEVVGLCHHCAALLRNEEPAHQSEEEMIAATASLNTHAALIAALTEAVNGVDAALRSSTEENLGRIITAPWGGELPLHLYAMIVVNHLWYHDGQLNYFQAIHGDGTIHWKM